MITMDVCEREKGLIMAYPMARRVRVHAIVAAAAADGKLS